jgi:hypothetical protein
VFKYSSRFWLYAPTLLFLTLAIAVMIHWWLAAGAFEKRLSALKGREAIPGVTLDWTGVQVGGFPFRLDADFSNFRVTGAGAHGPAAWASEKFALHALTYGRSQTVYEAAGRQLVDWTGADGSRHAASFLPGSMRGSSILDAQGLRRFDLEIVDMAGSDFAFTRFQFHMRRGATGLDLMLKAETLQSAADRMPADFQVYAGLNQAGAWAALLRGEMSWPKADAQWRSRGGKAALSQLIAPAMSPDFLLSPLY